MEGREGRRGKGREGREGGMPISLTRTLNSPSAEGSRINTCGNTILKLFADDAKLFGNIMLVLIDDSLSSLQRSLDRFSDWAKKWQLSTLTFKNVQSYITQNPEYILRLYFLNCIAIPHHTEYVDL
jgi:hypothetical protein